MAANYAKVGPELHEMADEGLVLAARAKARLGQSLSAAQHTEGHLYRWRGEASDVPRAPAPRGTPSLASRRGRKIRSRHQSSSDAERDGLIHECRGIGILRSSLYQCHGSRDNPDLSGRGYAPFCCQLATR